jgi:hypothetical protein
MAYKRLCKRRAECLGIKIIRSLQCDDILGKSPAAGDFDWTCLDGACILVGEHGEL